MSISKSSLNIFIKQKEFFESKETLDVSFRIRYLKKLKQTIYQHEDDIINALSNDLGKNSVMTEKIPKQPRTRICYQINR